MCSSDLTRREIFETYLSFWLLYKDFLRIICEGHIDAWLISSYECVMQRQLDILKTTFQDLSESEFKLIKAFLIGGLYQLKANWCAQGFKESPKELAILLDKILIPSTI